MMLGSVLWQRCECVVPALKILAEVSGVTLNSAAGADRVLVMSKGMSHIALVTEWAIGGKPHV
jgi:hypothetical protein